MTHEEGEARKVNDFVNMGQKETSSPKPSGLECLINKFLKLLRNRISNLYKQFF